MKKKRIQAKTDGTYKVGKGRPPEEYKFKKGQPSMNPLGGQLHDPVKKELKKLASNEVKEIITMLLESDISEIRRIAKDKKEKVIISWFAKVVLASLDKAPGKVIGMGTLNQLLDRAIGPVTSKVELSGPNGGPIENQNYAANMTEAERVAEIEKLRKAREKLGRD